MIYAVVQSEQMLRYFVDNLNSLLLLPSKRISTYIINMFLEIVDSADENKFDEILEKSMRNGVNYMQKKDFQVNDFLQDVDNLKSIAKNL